MQIENHDPKKLADAIEAPKLEPYEAPRVQSINLTPEAAEALT